MSSTKPTTSQILHDGDNLHDLLDKWIKRKHINVMDFGAKVDGVTPDQDAVNAAIAKAVELKVYNVYIPAGVCAVNREIVVPDYVNLYGAGRGVTRLFALDSMPKEHNVIRNSKWLYKVFGTDYNVGISIHDMTIDANHQGRDPDKSWVDATLGNCIFLGIARDCKVERLHAVNGIQHCIDIAAGYYFDDGNINHNAVGGSYNITLQDVYASNALLDDCITTHNSSSILLDNCHVWNDDPNMTWGNNQHGIEIDEGCKDILVRNCRATNLVTGFQQKGHDTTMPARNVTFDSCIADSCVYSFQVEHRNANTIPSGQVQNARSSRIINCTSINANNSKNTTLHARAIHIDGFYGVYINNFRIEGGAGNIYMTRGAKSIVIDGVLQDGGYTGAIDSASEGIIHVETGSGCDNYHVSNVTIEDSISVPVIRDLTDSPVHRSISNIYARGSNSSIPMIAIVPLSGDNISGLVPVGSWACALRDMARSAGLGDYNASVTFSNGNATQLGSGTPNNGIVCGRAGSVYIDVGSGGVAGEMYISSDTGVNHWRKLAFS